MPWAPARPATGPPGRRCKNLGWEAMQRRLARKAGQVASFHERPRLLEAAEDPEAWEDMLETWPDVAQKLRPSPLEMEVTEVPSLEDLMPWIHDALGADFVAENFHQLVPASPKGKVIEVPKEVRPSGAKTPPRLQLTGPKTLRQNLDKLMTSLQGGSDQRNSDLAGIDRQPRTVARQHYDLNKDPTVAADEFTLATRKAERRLNARKLLSLPMEGSGSLDAVELKSPRRKHRESSKEAQEVRSHLLERLDYLHTCRGSMGESLYAQQRQRLEMQAHLRTAQKYSLEEKPPEARCAYSAQVRGGKTNAWDPELVQALRPATAPEPLQGALPTRRVLTPPRSAAQVVKPPSPPKRDTGAEAVARTFNFARLCAAKRLPMPNLGAFTLGDEAQLKVPNWSLGDDPLMALASSPLKDNVAVVEEGDFAGNRISNRGVQAIVSSLGSDLTTLNLSANCFDCHGVESILSFIRHAPKLTDVNLSGNKLSDDSVSRLCLQLSQHCQHLQRLSLSDVMMGWDSDTTGAALGSLVTVLKMSNLDISFNALHGQGAIELLKNVPNSRLSCLDISWNCLGKGGHSKAVAEELSQVFQRGSLHHLDISYNSFQSQELEILSKGLAMNRTLWGLHIDGGAFMDADGFLIPPAEFKLESNNPRAPNGRGKKSKSKTARKQPKVPKKDVEVEISVAGTLLSPQELEVRLQALQGQMELQDLIQEYHQRMDQEEKEQMETARKEKTSLSLMQSSETDARIPVSMPELIRRLPPGQPMSPRSQDEMLHSLALEVRQELPSTLRACSERQRSFLYLQGTKENFLYKHSNCWICGQWVEVVLEAGPNDLPWPDDAKSKEKGVTVCALISIDNFSRPITLRANWDGIWRGSRFLPPTESCFVVFQVGEDVITTHQGLPVRSLQRPMTVPLWRQRDAAMCGNGNAMASCEEVNVLRVGELAQAYCNGAEPPRGAHVRCSAAQRAQRREKVSESNPRCPVAWTKVVEPV